jgi:hypothetical protein
MRRVKVVPLARRNLDAYVKQLNNSDPLAWPKFLYRAWAIVAEDLGKPDDAQRTVIDAVAAAHACAVAFSSRTLANERSQVREKALSAVLKILKPIERRAPIRREFNEVAQREFREGHADLDSIASFLNGCADAVRYFHGVPDAERIMRALGGPVDQIEMPEDGSEPRTLNLINHYEAMHPADRGAVEAGLRKLVSYPSAGFTALDVFSTIAHALTVAVITEPQEDGGDLLTAYVADVEKVWRRAGFRPSRVRNASKSKYRGPYHRFLELVLIDQLDPRSRLFDPLSEKEIELAGKIHASLPKELGKVTRIVPRYEWLISEHYLKTVKTPIEKTVLKTP